MQPTFIQRLLAAGLCGAIAFFFLAMGSGRAEMPGDHVYVIVDNAAGFIATGAPLRRTDETNGNVSVDRVYIEIIRALRSLPRRDHANTTIHFIDTVHRKVQSHTPGSLYDLTPDFLEGLQPGDFCGDFTKLFDTLLLQKQMDNPAKRHFIIVSPLIDIGDNLCRDTGAARPVLPQRPLRAYRINDIFSMSASISIIGAAQEQKRPWFDAFPRVPIFATPNFIDLDAAPGEIRRIIEGF